MGQLIVNMLYQTGEFLGSIWNFLEIIFVKTIPFTGGKTLWNIFSIGGTTTFLLGMLGMLIKSRGNIII